MVSFYKYSFGICVILKHNTVTSYEKAHVYVGMKQVKKQEWYFLLHAILQYGLWVILCTSLLKEMD